MISMLERLKQIEKRYEELTHRNSRRRSCCRISPLTAKLPSSIAALGDIVEKYRAWKSLKAGDSPARARLLDTADDDEMREMARLEVESLQAQTGSRRKTI